MTENDKKQYISKNKLVEYSGSLWVLKECIAQKWLELKDDDDDDD